MGRWDEEVSRVEERIFLYSFSIVSAMVFELESSVFSIFQILLRVFILATALVARIESLESSFEATVK